MFDHHLNFFSFEHVTRVTVFGYEDFQDAADCTAVLWLCATLMVN